MSEFNEIAEIGKGLAATTTAKGSHIPNTELKTAIAAIPLLEVKELKSVTKTGFNGTAPIAKAAKIAVPAETTAGVKKCCEEILTVLKNVGLTE